MTLRSRFGVFPVELCRCESPCQITLGVALLSGLAVGLIHILRLDETLKGSSRTVLLALARDWGTTDTTTRASPHCQRPLLRVGIEPRSDIYDAFPSLASTSPESPGSLLVVYVVLSGSLNRRATCARCTNRADSTPGVITLLGRISMSSTLPSSETPPEVCFPP